MGKVSLAISLTGKPNEGSRGRPRNNLYQREIISLYIRLLVKCYDIKMVKLPKGFLCRINFMQLTNNKKKPYTTLVEDFLWPSPNETFSNQLYLMLTHTKTDDISGLNISPYWR